MLNNSRMKRIWIILLVVVMVVTMLTACSQQAAPNSPASSGESETPVLPTKMVLLDCMAAYPVAANTPLR